MAYSHSTCPENFAPPQGFSFFESYEGSWKRFPLLRGPRPSGVSRKQRQSELRRGLQKRFPLLRGPREGGGPRPSRVSRKQRQSELPRGLRGLEDSRSAEKTPFVDQRHGRCTKPRRLPLRRRFARPDLGAPLGRARHDLRARHGHRLAVLEQNCAQRCLCPATASKGGLPDNPSQRTGRTGCQGVRGAA